MASSSVTRIPGNWKVLQICPDRSLSAQLKSLLFEHLACFNVVEVEDYPRPPELADILGAQQPNLCFVAVASKDTRALEVIAELAALNSALPVVALLGENDPDLILRCLRQGAMEFLLVPLTSKDLVEVLTRVAARAPAAAAGGRVGQVICAVPAKGACGASTLACNLAFQLKRNNARVLLADLDPYTGIQAFLLKVKPSYTFVDALTRAGNLDADIWRGMITRLHGIDVLLAPEQPVHGIESSQDPASIVNFARQMYDFVVIDCGSPYGGWNTTLMRLCDTILLVTTNELPAVQAAQRAISYLETNRIDRSKMRMVINRYFRDSGVTADVIQTALHVEVFHTLPSDYEALQDALVEGRPLTGNAPLAKALSQLAGRLSGTSRQLESEPEKRSTSRSSLLSLFSR